MSRIDASIATQIGDASRPYQAAAVRQQQVQQAAIQETAAPRGTIGADDLQAVAAQMQQVIEAASGRRLSFKVNDNTGQTYVEVSDEHTGDVITQIPSEEMLRMHERLSQMVGLFVDGTA